MSSAIFLTDIDDYLAPSQACVNPLYLPVVAAIADKKQGIVDIVEADAIQNTNTNNNSLEVPRRKRRARLDVSLSASNVSNNDNSVPSATAKKDPVQASIADCLACSGCITTAETILLEDHSLEKIQMALSKKEIRKIATISPASMADLCRALGLEQHVLAGLLAHTLSLHMLVDGTVPLQWSLDEAYLEFANQSLKKVPLISSSCPALVCLVEKNVHDAVAHLSRTKSSMMASAAAIAASCNCENTLHVAIMPCHDKKLEASRTTTDTSDNTNSVNTMVVTTQDCWNLLLERFTTAEAVRTYAATLAPITVVNEFYGGDWRRSNAPIYVTTSTEMSVCADENIDNDAFFPLGSGGYADTIFRRTCQDVYGVELCRVPWQRFANNSSANKLSARRAAAARHDFYTVTLYQHKDGTYSCEPQQQADGGVSVVVLQFGIAYGMQTMQRALQAYKNEQPITDKTIIKFDYLEAMACPSGCVNGGGQIRLASRETPSETRQRVAETKKHFVAASKASAVLVKNKPVDMSTTFRKVPPLQLSMGTGKGVAVKDVQW
jgi:iron only hydrogenase large subunit-like protein